MISFQQMGFNNMENLNLDNSQLSTLHSQLVLIVAFLLIGVQAVFALQIEAPREVAEQILAYAQEIGAEKQNVILRADIAKDTQCNTFSLKLIDKNSGKTIRKAERCSADLPNAALQSAVFEIFGHNVKNPENPKIGAIGIQTAIGIGFVAAGALLYYSNPPQPVYGVKK